MSSLEAKIKKCKKLVPAFGWEVAIFALVSEARGGLTEVGAWDLIGAPAVKRPQT
jgi:hypothetical protein